MKNLRKAEVAVVAVTLLVLVFTAGYFTGRSTGAHVIRFDQLPKTTATTTMMKAAPGSTASPAESAAPASASVQAAKGKLNINTATLPELDALPGIGQVLAKNILDYRQKAGGFKSIEQLIDVEGIGEKKFEAVKNLITVG